MNPARRDYIYRKVNKTGPFTVVEVSYFSLRAIGVAKKHPNDKEMPSIGIDLAYARALRNLADEMEKRATP